MRSIGRRIAILGALGTIAAGASALIRRKPSGGGVEKNVIEIPLSASILLRGTTIFDGTHTLPSLHDVLIRDGKIETVAPSGSLTIDAERVEGLAISPGFIDAHVHLSFSDAAAVAAAGISGALDLGEPLDVAFRAAPPLTMRWAGPILTAVAGYPTRSWGAGGYGLEIADDADVRRAVAMLHDRGAAIIKLAVQGSPSLTASMIRTAVSEADTRGLKTVAHALSLDAVRLVVNAGVSALAHTPVDPLPADIIETLGRRKADVISTIRAFGDADSTRTNLAKLAQAGCRVVYGTDLGNAGIQPGVDPIELEHLAALLGSPDKALATATTAAADLAGLPAPSIKAGSKATLTVWKTLQPRSLREPIAMWIDGKRIR